MARKIISTNKKAFGDYHMFDKYTAGIVLKGTEIKSLRSGGVNLKDSFCRIEEMEVFLYNCHISPYEQGNRYNHQTERVRKLLLNKSEIIKMLSKIKKEGYTIVPTQLFLENGWAKVEIALAKGKKLHDKREDIAKKSQQREIQRSMKK